MADITPVFGEKFTTLTNLATNPAPASVTGWSSYGSPWLVTYAAGEVSIDRQASAWEGGVASMQRLGGAPPILAAGTKHQRAVEVWTDLPGASVFGPDPAGFIGGQSIPVNTWTRVVEQFSGTGSTADVMAFGVLVPGYVGTGVHVKLRRAQLVANPGGTPLPYFDGSTPDTPTTDYAWTGTANASTSTAVTSPVMFTALVVEKGLTPVFGNAGSFTALVLERVVPVELPSLPPACYLYIDGERYNDGSTGEPAGEPVALTNLRVNWGRQTNLDQPSPTTISFSVLDEIGGQRFLDRLHIGAVVDVVAQATVYPDPTVSIIADPGFETAALSALTVNATAAIVTGNPHSGVKSVRVDPVDGTRRAQVIFPPRAFTTNISGWDSVPRTAPGQTWHYGAAVWLGEFLAAVQGATVYPVAFTSPTGQPGTFTVLPDSVPASFAAGWQVLTGDVVPPAGSWLGVCVELWPTGPAWNQLPAGITWAGLGATPTWQDLAAAWVDDLVVLAPDTGALRTGYVASGRITDLEARYELGLGATVVDVIAQSHLAELNNRYVGDVPWLEEGLSARFAKIVTASGQAIPWTVDPTVSALPVSWRDVDNQPALRLLQELATSCGGALWSAVNPGNGGAYLWLEDIDQRVSLLLLEMGDDGLVHIVTDPVVGTDGLELSSCDVLLEPVRWRQTTEDNASRVAVIWRDQTLDDKGQIRPTDRTETVVDTALETATGQRRISVTTQLSRQLDAQHVAGSMLARVSSDGWRVAGLTISVADEDQLDARMIANVMTILDSSTRIGLGMVITDLPAFSPTQADTAAVFLEGGRFVNLDGAWSLELIVSSAASQGAADIAWQDLPASVTVRSNLFTRPSFEDNSVTGFTPSNGTLTTPVTSTPANGGVRVLRLTVTAAGAGASVVPVTTLRPPVTPGKTYRITAWVRTTTPGAAPRVRLDSTYRDSGGAAIGTFVSSPVLTLAPDVWQRLELNQIVAPGTAVTIALTLNAPTGSSNTAGMILDWDAIMVSEITAATDPAVTYFDGDTPDTAMVDYAWTGTAGASVSTATDQSTIWRWVDFAPEVSWSDLTGVGL